jgi:hypothetical protein
MSCIVVEMREWMNECWVRWCGMVIHYVVTCDRVFVTCDRVFVTCDRVFVTCDRVFVTCDHVCCDM